MLGTINKEVVLVEFKNWLQTERGLTSNSADQYKSYVKKALEDFAIDTFSEGEPTDKKLFNHSTLQETVLSARIASSSYEKKKSESNKRSGIRQFNIFLEDSGYVYSTEINSDTLEKELAIINFDSDIPYSNKELMSKFRARLNTQDRCYAKLILSFRAINKILNSSAEKDEYNQFMQGEVENIEFLTNQGIFKLSNVKQICISSDETVKLIPKHKVGRSTKDYLVYSRDGEKLLTNRIDDVSLDHRKSLYKIVDEMEKKDFPTFFELSNSLKEFFGETEVAKISKVMRDNRGVLTNEFYQKVGQFIDSKSLFDEMKKLYQQIDLVIMHRSHNSSKNKY